MTTVGIERVRAEQVRDLYRNAPVGVGSALIGVAILSWLLLILQPEIKDRVMLWLALTGFSAALQLTLTALYRRADPPDADWRRWARAFTAASLLEGLRWGFGAVWVAGVEPGPTELWVLLVAAAATSGSASSLGSYTVAFYALLFPAMTPFIAMSLARPGAASKIAGILVLVFLVSLALLGRAQGRRLQEALRLRFENQDLARSLETQRSRAEEANRAKTRFLASASHDLRQPTHALGMFVEALRLRPAEPETRALVEHIADTTAALEGLFDSLLDISQLDAGLITPHLSVFPIQPLLTRLAREHGAELAAKGVRLRAPPCSVMVRSDPQLVERVLRNLVSNAVRHTPAGDVLLGCRRGDRLRVCVVDTGVGIAPDQQERVFDEFHQVGNAERNRSRGLGLGLAISRRTAGLLDCPLELRSEPGRGTTVSLSLPVAAPGERPTPTADNPPAPPTEAGGRLIVVIEDDREAREGASTLLRAWGHEVVEGAGGAEAQARLDALGRAPDLAICDWRLAGDDGLEVAGRLRARYGEALPVLLVTGDTALPPARLADAPGVIVLHKPLSGGKLRAALGAALRAASALDTGLQGSDQTGAAGVGDGLLPVADVQGAEDR